MRFGRVFATLGLVALIAGASFAAGGGQSRPGAPVEAQVMRQLAKNGDASFWVVLRGEADVSSAARIRSRSLRGVQVYERLTSYARESQAPLPRVARRPEHPLPALLDRQRDLRQGGRSRSAGRHRRAPRREADPREPLVRDPESDRHSLQGEPRRGGVGAERDPRAAGLVGLQRPRRRHRHLQHRHGRPLLAPGARRSLPRKPRRRQLRPQLQLVGPAARVPDRRPVRQRTHGTHTMGTMVGDDGDPAPTRSASRHTPSGSWRRAAASTPRSSRRASGSSRRPTRAGTTPVPTCGRTSSTTPGAAAPETRSSSPRSRPGSQRASSRPSRTGTRARTAPPPAPPATSPRPTPPERSTSTGTSRASPPRPLAFGGLIKPNISAPGVNVRSSESGSDTQYGSLSGTSMASPHVAGTVALIWSISPELRGDIAANGSAPRPDRDRRQQHDLRRHAGRQQRLGRRQDRRARGRHRCSEGADRNACRDGSATPTT